MRARRRVARLLHSMGGLWLMTCHSNIVCACVCLAADALLPLVTPHAGCSQAPRSSSHPLSRRCCCLNRCRQPPAPLLSRPHPYGPLQLWCWCWWWCRWWWQQQRHQGHTRPRPALPQPHTPQWGQGWCGWFIPRPVRVQGWAQAVICWARRV